MEYEDFKNIFLQRVEEDRQYTSNAAFSEYLQKLYNLLVALTSKKMGIPAIKIASKINEIIITNNPNIQGYLKMQGDVGGVYINYGLVRFYYQMSKIIASRIGYYDASGNIIDSQIPIDETKEKFKDLMELYWKGQLLNAKSFSVNELSGSQILLSAVVLDLTTFFTIAHEYGHFILNEIKKKPIECDFAEDGIRLFISINNLRITDENLIEKWSKEIAADIIAFQFTIEYSNYRPNSHKLLLYNSCDLMFVMLDLLIQYGIKSGRMLSDIFDSHPPTKLRLEAIRTVAEQNGFIKPLEVARNIQGISEQFYKQIQ